jgi:hypothetical protein
VGITYIDLSALGELITLDFGDFETAYQSVIDEVNANGGVNGRMIEADFAPVSPVGDDAADAACAELTQDDPVFVTVGFFQADQVLCYLETNETAVIGGTMTPERLARANAPWYSLDPSSRLEVDAIRAFADQGLLDGNVAVVGTVQNEANLNDVIVPLLDELGIEPVDVGVIDAPDGDVAAQNDATRIIAERFEAAGADTVLVTGEAGLPWANGIEPTTYRPRNIFPLVNSIRAYTSDEANRDLSVVEDAVAGGLYESPSDELPEGNGIEDSFATQEAAGLTILPPGDVPEGDPIQIAASGPACVNVSLLVQLLEAAGDDLNYGTFANAGSQLGEVDLPGSPDPATFGPGEDGDGNPTVYVYEWDPEEEDFAIVNR